MTSVIEQIEFDGAKIRELRGSRSQSDVAKSVGISRQALNQIEQGETKPSADTLLRLCSVLKIELSDLCKIF